MSDPRSLTARILTWNGDALIARDDRTAVEEPLEIRLNGRALSITMRTPGHDRELAAGFLHGEGLIHSLADLVAVGPVLAGAGRKNEVELATYRPVNMERVERNFYATSSCGVCGKSSLKAIATLADPVPMGFQLDPRVLPRLPDVLRRAQETFETTGSLHAAGLFDGMGKLTTLHEDVGRHNAVDKVVGERLWADALQLSDSVLLVSGRTSFEIVQKAVMARIPVVAAISGPSSLAVDLAARFGVTLVGFLRGERFNVYTHPQRVGGPA